MQSVQPDGTPEANGRHKSLGRCGRIWNLVYGIIRASLIALNNLLAVPTYIVWCYLLLPLRAIAPEFYQRMEQVPFRWLQYCMAHFLITAGYEIHESGDDVLELLAQRQCLLVFNHQSTADVPMIMALLADESKYPVGQRVCWIMDQLFRYTHFGIVSSFHGDFFIQQGRETRQNQLVELKDHLETIYRTRDRTCILLFPEGGFLYKRRETSQRFALKHGYPVLQHTTLPRIGAMETILKTQVPSTNAVRDEDSGSCDSTNTPPNDKPLEWLVDVTIAYPGGRPLDLGIICRGSEPPCRTIVHYRGYHINHVPWNDSEALLKWIYDRWAEKDAMLDEYYKTGQFPSSKYRGMMDANTSSGVGAATLHGSDGTMRKLPFDIRWCLFYNVIFVLSTYSHWRMLTLLWSMLISLFH